MMTQCSDVSCTEGVTLGSRMLHKPIMTRCSAVSLVQAPQSVVTLLQLGGLRALQTPEAMPAGVLTPGRFKHAGQALGKRPD